jgi:WD40 repeat protein
MNHDHFFVGMDDGDIYVFDLTVKTFSKFKVDYKQLFPDKPSTAVSDIKCHPHKMHRLLIAFQNTAIAVFSLNKNRIIQRIMMSQDGGAKSPKGRVLAVEWLGPDCKEFVAGFDQNVI